MNKTELFKKLYFHPMKTVAGAIRYDCGELLSQGLNRDVYVCKHDSNWVVKIQKTNHFDNIIEWKIWLALRFAYNDKKWFAECISITESGLVLVQKRIKHGNIEDYPKKVPAYFTDFKTTNYGWIGKQFVCCDYSNVLDMLTGLMPSKLRTAKWWEADGKIKRTKTISLSKKYSTK